MRRGGFSYSAHCISIPISDSRAKTRATLIKMTLRYARARLAFPPHAKYVRFLWNANSARFLNKTKRHMRRFADAKQNKTADRRSRFRADKNPTSHANRRTGRTAKNPTPIPFANRRETPQTIPQKQNHRQATKAKAKTHRPAKLRRTETAAAANQQRPHLRHTARDQTFVNSARPQTAMRQ